eukprot:4830939-Karenia_brevis.AAC.1
MWWDPPTPLWKSSELHVHGLGVMWAEHGTSPKGIYTMLPTHGLGSRDPRGPHRCTCKKLAGGP